MSSGDMEGPPPPLPAFGRPMRDAEFLLDPTSVHINHGSWGAAPRRVFDARVKWLREVEFQPDTYFRRVIEKAWFDNLKNVSDYLGLNPDNVTFVENATSGINSALKGLPLTVEDQIMVYSWTYNAIRKTCERMAEMSGAEVVTLDLSYPIVSEQSVVDQYQAFLDKHPKVKVTVIDYISSATATKFPVAALVEECKKRNIISIVDGAHTPGHIKLDIEEIDPDFYVGTLHKWVFVPRGCTLLRVAQRFQETARPAVTSHCYKMKPWQMDFYYQATRDSTPYVVAKEGVKFHQDLGGLEGIYAYVKPLLSEAVAHLVDVWGTETFQIPPEMEAPFLKLVRLPEMQNYPVKSTEGVFGDLHDLMYDLYKRFNVHCTSLIIYGKPWIRLSATVYNTLDEYKKVGQYILTLKNESGNLE